MSPWGTTTRQARGHSIEFRLNAEDAGRGFLPAAGTLTQWEPPSGPGVRLDTGYVRGQAIPREYDSLIAKLIVTGASRRQAIERARRALGGFVIDGVPTILPFHRAVLDDPAFIPDDDAAQFSVHTLWIETEFDNKIDPYGVMAPDEDQQAGNAERLIVEVSGKRVEVVLPARNAPEAVGATSPRRPGRQPDGASRSSGDALVSPMHGTIVTLRVGDNAVIGIGDTVAVLEAMKMEQPITAHKAGTVTRLAARVGDAVSSGTVICEIKD